MVRFGFVLLYRPECRFPPVRPRSDMYCRHVTRAELSVNEQGRVTIPAQLRRELGITPGSRLVASVEDGRLVLEDRRHLLSRIQDEIARSSAAAGISGSAADELIAERRAEAERENGTASS
jgi:AbrB family looped-hinge helix DNA binding protein